jgi:hypothetical protein
MWPPRPSTSDMSYYILHSMYHSTVPYVPSNLLSPSIPPPFWSKYVDDGLPLQASLPAMMSSSVSRVFLQHGRGGGKDVNLSRGTEY